MTPGQQALADGFAINLGVHGQTWTRTSDSAAIIGVPTRLSLENPHLEQSQDRNQIIRVADASLSPPLTAAQVMPSTRIKKGDELTKSSKKYRVVRADFNDSNALWYVQLSPTF